MIVKHLPSLDSALRFYMWNMSFIVGNNFSLIYHSYLCVGAIFIYFWQLIHVFVCFGLCANRNSKISDLCELMCILFHFQIVYFILVWQTFQPKAFHSSVLCVSRSTWFNGKQYLLYDSCVCVMFSISFNRNCTSFA